MLSPYLFALHVPNVINHAFIKKLKMSIFINCWQTQKKSLNMCKTSSQKLFQELPIISAHGTLPFFPEISNWKNRESSLISCMRTFLFYTCWWFLKELVEFVSVCGWCLSLIKISVAIENGTLSFKRMLIRIDVVPFLGFQPSPSPGLRTGLSKYTWTWTHLRAKPHGSRWT